MKILNQAQLTMELKRIIQTVKENDKKTLQEKQDLLFEGLKISKKEFVRFPKMMVFSKEISFHILSIHFLLSVIDFYYDGEKIYDRDFDKNLFLLKELSCKEKKEIEPLQLNKKMAERIEHLLDGQLFVYLLPFQSEDQYIIKSTYQGTVIILYASDHGTEHSFLKAVAERTLKERFSNELPKWAANHDDYYDQFIQWVHNQKTLPI